MDWLDLFAVQGTLKSLLQHNSSKASILRHSAFFTVQLSHPYILWHCLSLRLEWKHLFQSCGHCWVFQIFCHIECSTFTAASFRIWNSSMGIPSPPLALFVVMLPKAYLACIPGCLALGEWSHHHDYQGCDDLFVSFFCVFLPPFLNIFCFC